MKTSILAVVITAVFSVSVSAAPATYDPVWGDSVESSVAANKNNLDNLHQEILQLNAGATTVSQLQTQVTNFDADQKRQDAAAAVRDGEISGLGQDVLRIDSTNNQQNQEIKANSLDIVDHESRITTLENAPKPTNGVDGKDGTDGKDGVNGRDGVDGVGIKGDKGDAGATGLDGVDGKDGVTTTVTQIQVDSATQTKVASNSRQALAQQRTIANNSQRINKLENSFSSLKEQVEGDRKEARSGSAAAVAIASMPQVNANQKVMVSAGVGQFKDASALAVGASFNAGSAVVKAGISTTTNNDFALGAGVGLGF